MKLAKFWLKKILARMNLDVRRVGVGPQSLKKFAGADAITFQYLADLRITPYKPIESAAARAGIMGFTFGPGSGHPLMRAFAAADANVDDASSRAAIRNVLKEFYASVRPHSGLDVLGLTSADAPGLVDVSLHGWVMPWTERSPEETEAHRRTCLEEEGLSQGKRVSLEDGATLFGPASDAKLDLEVERIHSLARSFAARGFQPDSAHPIEVIGLVSRGAYRWLIVQGQHRVAACATFGIATLEARILRVIRREDAVHWPHVVLGTFTTAGALKCFDRLFAGQESACATSWAKRFQPHEAQPRDRKIA